MVRISRRRRRMLQRRRIRRRQIRMHRAVRLEMLALALWLGMLEAAVLLTVLDAGAKVMAVSVLISDGCAEWRLSAAVAMNGARGCIGRSSSAYHGSSFPPAARESPARRLFVFRRRNRTNAWKDCCQHRPEN